jgi:hypothetical protein
MKANVITVNQMCQKGVKVMIKPHLKLEKNQLIFSKITK